MYIFYDFICVHYKKMSDDETTKKKTTRTRKPAFTDSENMLMANFYKDHCHVFRCSDQKAGAASRKRAKFAELTGIINNQDGAINRAVNDVVQRLKVML